MRLVPGMSPRIVLCNRSDVADVILPDPAFRVFEKKLNAERQQSQYRYGFPDGDGDCNCVTWLERLALPLISGSMAEFAHATASSRYPSRRFGQCI